MSIVRRTDTKTERKPRHSVTATDETEWLGAVERGEALAVVARRAGVDRRTVRDHVARARDERELREVRRQLFVGAAQAHQQELLGLAASLEALLSVSAHSLRESLEMTPPWLRSAGKVYQALLRHTTGSGLPSSLSRWSAAATRYEALVSRLAGRLGTEIVSSGLDLEGAVHHLLRAATHCVSVAELPADELPWRVEGGELRKGAVRLLGEVASLGDTRVVAAQEQYTRLWDTLRTSDEVAELCALRTSAGPIRERLADQLEDIRLRRYLGPGTCRWCPGSRSSGRRTPPKARG